MQNGLNDPRAFLRCLFDEAVRVADPMRVVGAHLPPKPDERVIVIGAGKASARMAEALEAQWGPCEGLVITRYGYARPCAGIEIVEAAHPVPDQAGVDATHRILELLKNLTPYDHVIALISGGGSALLCAPADGLTLARKQEVNIALLASGAPIEVMNIIRKSLSRVKGGRLAAAAYPAKLTTLMVSDVPGDDPAIIASGPTVLSDDQNVLELRAKYLPEFPDLDEIIAQNPAPKSANALNKIIAAPSQSLVAAKALAEAYIPTTILGDAIEGEAREVALTHAKLASNTNAPHLFLSGGELTVTKRGNGIGGPNAEYALALALELNGARNIYALACDTDGVDGAAEVAGAFIDPTTLLRGGVDIAKKALENNDAHRFFERIGDQIITGPTLTNVNDFRAILVM